MAGQHNKAGQSKTSDKEERDHEMESLKNRIQTLDKLLVEKDETYASLQQQYEQLDGRFKAAEKMLEVANANLQQAAEADSPTQHRSLVSVVPPEIRAGLVIFALGAIRDRQNDAPMDKKNFEHMVDPFIDQAEYIADKVIARMTTSKTEEQAS